MPQRTAAGCGARRRPDAACRGRARPLGDNRAMAYEFERKQRIAIVGGGPGGYEAALAGAQLGAEVTLVERVGVGGSAVLTDIVPSKTLIATAEAANAIGDATGLGVQFFARGESGRPVRPEVAVNLAAVNQRLLRLARQQSEDMKAALIRAGVTRDPGRRPPGRPAARRGLLRQGQTRHRLRRDRRGHHRRVGRREPRASCPSAKPDGERILTWTQLYSLDRPPGAPDRGRLRRHRRRVRLRLHGARLQGHPHLQPRTGAARRGRGCRRRSSRACSSATG